LTVGFHGQAKDAKVGGDICALLLTVARNLAGGATIGFVRSDPRMGQKKGVEHTVASAIIWTIRVKQKFPTPKIERRMPTTV